MSKLMNCVRVCLATMILTTPVYGHQPHEPMRIRKSVVINASPRACWEAIRNPASCRDHRRVISHNNDEAIVEETFENLPLIHSSICVFRESEKPFERIDYSLIRSSKFKAMEGSWILTPTDDGKTIVEVSSFLDTGLRVPFARRMTDELTQQKCQERLQLVKALAETMQTRQAQNL